MISKLNEMTPAVGKIIECVLGHSLWAKQLNVGLWPIMKTWLDKLCEEIDFKIVSVSPE